MKRISLFLAFLAVMSLGLKAQPKQQKQQKQKYDVAAYLYPAYAADDPRLRPFWPMGFGEWETSLLMLQVFGNDLVFSFIYGLPLFIVLTSVRDGGHWWTPRKTSHLLKGNAVEGWRAFFRHHPRVSLGLILTDVFVLFLIMAGYIARFFPGQRTLFVILSILALVLTLVLCTLPVRAEQE